jgi:hypothetical protein
MLRLPSIDILRARTAEDLHAALDHMRAPAQNAIFVTYRGDIGYRVGGTGVERAANGLEVQDALPSECEEPERHERRAGEERPAVKPRFGLRSDRPVNGNASQQRDVGR